MYPPESIEMDMSVEVEYLLFSSAARKVYEQDSLNITSAPPGYGLRFRYRSKWVPHHINSDRMVGSTAIIVDVVGNVEESCDLIYTPLREAKIIATEDFDGTVYLDLKLTEGLVDYTAEVTAEQYHSKIISSGNNGPREENYIVESDEVKFELARTDPHSDSPIKWSDLEPQWIELIDILCERHDGFGSGFFYRLMEVSRTSGSLIGCILGYNDIVELDEDLEFKKIGGNTTRGIQLQNDCEYELKISFYYPDNNDKDTFRFSLITNTSSGIFPNEIQSGFQTDMRDFHFVPETSIHRSIDVAEGLVEKNGSQPKSPNLSFPIELTPPTGIKLGFLGLFSIGLAISTGLFNPIIGNVKLIPAPEFAVEKFFQLIGVAVVTLVFTLYSDYM